MNLEILGLILISAKQMAMQVFTDINSQIHDGKERRALMMRLDESTDDNNFRLILQSHSKFKELKNKFEAEAKDLPQQLQLADEVLKAAADLFVVGAEEMGEEEKKALHREIVPRFLKVLQFYMQYYQSTSMRRMPFLDGGVLSRFFQHILHMPIKE